MSNPIVIASLRTLNASRFTLFKAQRFGKTKYLCDDQGIVHVCATYRGTTYYMGALHEVVGSPLDFIFKVLRNMFALVGVLALFAHIGLYYGGLYHYLLTVYPTSTVLQFITWS